jgi:hypothetical protein
MYYGGLPSLQEESSLALRNLEKLVQNLSLSSFAPTRVLAGAQMVQPANGRAFLLDCPGYPDRVDYAERQQAHLEIFGLVVSNIPRSHLLAVTARTIPGVRVTGFMHNGLRQPDGELGGP